jgi:hypothetical protein
MHQRKVISKNVNELYTIFNNFLKRNLALQILVTAYSLYDAVCNNFCILWRLVSYYLIFLVVQYTVNKVCTGTFLIQRIPFAVLLEREDYCIAYLGS